MDVSSLAKMRVSLLKFEPRVSNFPVLSSRVADSTRATAQSLFSLKRTNIKVANTMWLGFAEVEKGRQGNRDIDFLAVLATLEKFILFNVMLLN